MYIYFYKYYRYPSYVLFHLTICRIVNYVQVLLVESCWKEYYRQIFFQHFILNLYISFTNRSFQLILSPSFFFFGNLRMSDQQENLLVEVVTFDLLFRSVIIISKLGLNLQSLIYCKRLCMNLNGRLLLIFFFFFLLSHGYFGWSGIFKPDCRGETAGQKI